MLRMLRFQYIGAPMLVVVRTKAFAAVGAAIVVRTSAHTHSAVRIGKRPMRAISVPADGVVGGPHFPQARSSPAGWPVAGGASRPNPSTSGHRAQNFRHAAGASTEKQKAQNLAIHAEILG